MGRPSTRLILAYIFDWVAIIAIAAAGGGINFVTPYMRPFSLLNLDISYPYVPELVSTVTLVIVSLIAPAIIIAIVVALLVPGPAVFRKSTKSQVLRMKLWEFERGWAGLAFAVATAFFITQGMKNLFGKPRPDLLDRCKPDLENVAAHVVGGFGQDISERWTLVSASICTQTDQSVLKDGFRSFPSGHSSFSWSGLLYLSLFLCSKFMITIPYLPVQPMGLDTVRQQNERELLPVHNNNREASEDSVKRDEQGRMSLDPLRPREAALHPNHPSKIRHLAASPPTYLVIPAFLPIAVAIWITSTRYAQFYHHGFDVISGSLIGILTAYGSFRWYHLPISRGQGWAWGPRSRERAFGIGVGTGGYVGKEGWGSSKGLKRQTENGTA